LGLLGALSVLALFGVIIVRGLRLTSRIEEPFDQNLAFGLTVLLGLQALIHMGVVMGSCRPKDWCCRLSVTAARQC
jgi:cell division protein FtsW